MTIVDVYNIRGEKVSQMDLNENVFDVSIKNHVLHQVVLGQLHNRRSGTASTKGRSEVKGSGKKLWRQKGTGRARVGAASSPTRRGGGIAFGPEARKYFHKIPKKVRKHALRMALTDKTRSNRLFVMSDFDLDMIKTKHFVQVMKTFDVDKALIVTDDKNENLEKSSRNVSWVKVMRYQGLNVSDILNHEHLFLVQSAVARIEEALTS